MGTLNTRVIATIAGAALVATASFTASFEGVVNKVYTDPVGHKAVCVGHDSYAPDGSPLAPGTVYTDDECSVLFARDLKEAAALVAKYYSGTLSDGERLAYTDFVFNVGGAAFGSSTLLRKLKAGDRRGACAQLLVWNKGKVKGVLVVLPGLDTRRKAEYAQCVAGI